MSLKEQITEDMKTAMRAKDTERLGTIRLLQRERFRQFDVDRPLFHGLLHLLGHDHAEPDEKKVMFDLNDRIIAGWKASRR